MFDKIAKALGFQKRSLFDPPRQSPKGPPWMTPSPAPVIYASTAREVDRPAPPPPPSTIPLGPWLVSGFSTPQSAGGNRQVLSDRYPANEKMPVHAIDMVKHATPFNSESYQNPLRDEHLVGAGTMLNTWMGETYQLLQDPCPPPNHTRGGGPDKTRESIQQQRRLENAMGGVDRRGQRIKRESRLPDPSYDGGPAMASAQWLQARSLEQECQERTAQAFFGTFNDEHPTGGPEQTRQPLPPLMIFPNLPPTSALDLEERPPAAVDGHLWGALAEAPQVRLRTDQEPLHGRVSAGPSVSGLTNESLQHRSQQQNLSQQQSKSPPILGLSGHGNAVSGWLLEDSTKDLAALPALNLHLTSQTQTRTQAQTQNQDSQAFTEQTLQMTTYGSTQQLQGQSQSRSTKLSHLTSEQQILDTNTHGNAQQLQSQSETQCMPKNAQSLSQHSLQTVTSGGALKTQVGTVEQDKTTYNVLQRLAEIEAYKDPRATYQTLAKNDLHVQPKTLQAIPHATVSLATKADLPAARRMPAILGPLTGQQQVAGRAAVSDLQSSFGSSFGSLQQMPLFDELPEIVDSRVQLQQMPVLQEPQFHSVPQNNQFTQFGQNPIAARTAVQRQTDRTAKQALTTWVSKDEKTDPSLRAGISKLLAQSSTSTPAPLMKSVEAQTMIYGSFSGLCEVQEQPTHHCSTEGFVPQSNVLTAAASLLEPEDLQRDRSSLEYASQGPLNTAEQQQMAASSHQIQNAPRVEVAERNDTLPRAEASEKYVEKVYAPGQSFQREDLQVHLNSQAMKLREEQAALAPAAIFSEMKTRPPAAQAHRLKLDKAPHEIFQAPHQDSYAAVPGVLTTVEPSTNNRGHHEERAFASTYVGADSQPHVSRLRGLRDLKTLRGDSESVGGSRSIGEPPVQVRRLLSQETARPQRGRSPPRRQTMQPVLVEERGCAAGRFLSEPLTSRSN